MLLSQLLKRDGDDHVTTICRFYCTIVHQTLLYGSATWTASNVTSSINCLDRIQEEARCARGMTHQPIHHCSDKTWWIHPHMITYF
jgi:hypothetical protein